MKPIVLASASLGRKELLEKAGVQFSIDVSNFEEQLDTTISPAQLAVQLAEGKARIVAARHVNSIVIAADSFVVIANQILGKPKSEENAREMLGMVSARVHAFITGFVVFDIEFGKLFKQTVETKVYMKELSDEEINAYVKTKEPMGKAAGYALQGIGSMFIEKIEGSVSNVVGLPMFELREALRKFGIDILDQKT